MIAVTRTAPAKLNINLHITGRREDGYHLLDSVFVFTGRGDVVTATQADGLSLQIDGPFATDLQAEGNAAPDNLMLSAGRALQDYAGIKVGAALTLRKNLPIAAGIGGGSADAAATLLALVELWAVEINHADLMGLGLDLGADIPACLQGRPCRVRGIGEDVSPVTLPWLAQPKPVLLVNPGQPLFTAEVFERYQASSGAFSPPLMAADLASLDSVASQTLNSLQETARQAMPDIDTVLAILQEQGAALVRMSGSGPTCFAVFDHDHDLIRAAHYIRSAWPNWWVWEDHIMPGAL